MENPKPTQSALWERINKTHITKANVRELGGFKSGAINFKLSLWNPRANGVRYLKALVYNLCTSLSSQEWAMIAKIRNRDFGDPITVRYNGEEICLDYLQAVYEVVFIANSVDLNKASILEIGAGYGRTCHAIMSNYDVSRYCVVDLENCLDLSDRYLRQVLDASTYARIDFVVAEKFERLGDAYFDLCINIDSFAEMDERVVRLYLGYISKQCCCFYAKNPVGKYMDKSLDAHHEGEEAVQLALKTGVLREVLDIHDSECVEAHVASFIEAYRPGQSWQCIDSSWAKPWSYYWQAMYGKANAQGT